MGNKIPTERLIFENMVHFTRLIILLRTNNPTVGSHQNPSSGPTNGPLLLESDRILQILGCVSESATRILVPDPIGFVVGFIHLVRR